MDKALVGRTKKRLGRYVKRRNFTQNEPFSLLILLATSTTLIAYASGLRLGVPEDGADVDDDRFIRIFAGSSVTTITPIRNALLALS